MHSDIRRDSAVISLILNIFSRRVNLNPVQDCLQMKIVCSCTDQALDVWKQKSSENSSGSLLCWATQQLLCRPTASWGNHKTDAVLAWDKVAIKIKSELLLISAAGEKQSEEWADLHLAE